MSASIAFSHLHPALAPFAGGLAAWRHGEDPASPSRLPTRGTLNAWAIQAALALPDGTPLRFVRAPGRSTSAVAYERRVREQGQIATRDGSLHDLCNALAWLAFPQTKAALNGVHCAGARESADSRGRGAARDAATLLDEFGVIVTCADPELVTLWRAHAWRVLFHDRREDVARAMCIAVVGHGLMRALLEPYPALTAKALVLEVSTSELAPSDAPGALDTLAAASIGIRGKTWSPGDLLPLPIAAWPAWHPCPENPERFEDVGIFRPPRTPRSFGQFARQASNARTGRRVHGMLDTGAAVDARANRS